MNKNQKEIVQKIIDGFGADMTQIRLQLRENKWKLKNIAQENAALKRRRGIIQGNIRTMKEGLGEWKPKCEKKREIRPK